MLRLAAQYILEAGVQLGCMVHDAVLVEADADDIDDAVASTRDAMARSSRDILAGFELRTDAEMVHWPNRYRDPRGAAFFDELLRMLPPTGSSE